MNRQIIAIGAAVAVGGVWVSVCALAGWSLCGFAGILLGLLVGGTIYGFCREDAGSVEGMIAASLVIMLMFIGVVLRQSFERNAALRAVQSDASFVAALAEQILWQRQIEEPDANKNDDELHTASTKTAAIPADLLEQAQAEWDAMSEQDKQKARQDRQEWIEHSHGSKLERFYGASSKSKTFAIPIVASVMAMCVAAWPALAVRFVEGG